MRNPNDCACDGESYCDQHKPPVTISDLANHVLGREARTGADFLEARLPMMGGCEVCGASVACYNSHPSKSGNIRCSDCIGEHGYKTVEEANAAVFGSAL